MNTVACTFVKPRTFDDLISTLQGDLELDPIRRRDVVSAIRRFTTLLEIDLAAPAGVRAYQDRIDAFHLGRHGVKAHRWSTIRSDAGFALDRYGIVERHRPLPDDLSPAWRVLREDLSTVDHRLFRRLSSFVYFCSRSGIAPETVNDSTVSIFLDARANSLRKTKRKRTHRLLCACWNRAVEVVASWPKVCVTIPDFRKAYGLPLTAFPHSFQNEVAQWRDLHAGKAPLDPKAPMRPVSPATLHTRSEQVRRFASALVHAGMATERITSLTVLVEPKHFRLALEYLLARAQNQSTATIGETALGIYYIARHWVKVDDNVLGKLKEFCDRVRCRRRGLTDKNMERLRQFNDPLNVLRIVTLPEVLEAAARKVTTPKRTAQLMQTALAISILLVAPMRLRNLRDLDLDGHVQRSRRGRGAAVMLAIEPDEVKNRVPLEFELPPEVVGLLDRYTEHHLPAAPK